MGTYDLFRKISQSNLTSKQRDVNEMKSDIINDFEDTPSFYTVNINGVSQGVHLITEKDTKKMLSKPSESFDVGDIVDIADWNNSKWLVSELDADVQLQKKGIILECDNHLTFYKPDINSSPVQISYVVFDTVSLTRMGINSNKYLTTPNSRMMIMISDTNITKHIDRDDIYELYNSDGVKDNYKVIDINRARKPGLIIIELEYSPEPQQPHTFTLSILNGSALQIAQSQSLTINTQITDNGEIISNPSLSYSSSNINIATINSSGVVTILDVGTVVFTVRMSSDNTVSDSISVEIVADEVDNFTVQITGSNSIVKSYTSNYSCDFKNNGLPIADSSIFYLTADDGVSPTTLAEITTQNGSLNTCTIKGNNLGYVKLFVKNVGETVVSQVLRIQVKNLF